MELLPLSLPFPHLAAPSNRDSLFPGFHSLWSGTMMAKTFLNHSPFPTPIITSSSALLRSTSEASGAPQAPLQKCPCTGGCPLGSAVPVVVVPVAQRVLPMSLMMLNRKSVLNLKNAMRFSVEASKPSNLATLPWRKCSPYAEAYWNPLGGKTLADRLCGYSEQKCYPTHPNMLCCPCVDFFNPIGPCPCSASDPSDDWS